MRRNHQAPQRPGGASEVSGIDRVPAGIATIVLFVGFAAAALLVYSPALDGGFVSDDLVYVAANPYVQNPSAENVLIILDPVGPATTGVVNWAPVHLLVHAVEWQVFGPDTRGYHVINVLLHALASTLFAVVLVVSGVTRRIAGVAAAVFLLHPANVEAVAWISQLKTILSMVLALCALLAWTKRPALASGAFAVALLTKATAAFVLPVAILREWMQWKRVRWGWVALWTALLAGYAIAELAAHNRTGAAESLSADLPVLVRTIVAIAGRYLVMAATSLGTSALHEPPLAGSWLDPWWLGGLALLVLLGWRTVAGIRAGREEAVYWVWAGVSFLPVSQVFPFLYPMADRYLYFILPGLIGGICLAGRSSIAFRSSRRLRRALLAAALLACVFFAWRSHGRAGIWISEERLAADAAVHYPDGRAAHLDAARLASSEGDTEAAIRELRLAIDRGYNRFGPLLRLPEFAPLKTDPRFRALVAEVAQWWIDWGRSLKEPTQEELRVVAMAHVARREFAEAETYLLRALEEEGPLDSTIRNEIDLVRRAQRDPSIEVVPY